MNKGRNTTKRKCIVWFNSLSEKEKFTVFEVVSYKICDYLSQGHSINLAKAMVRNEVSLGFKLIDHIGRRSIKVAKVKEILKTQLSSS